MIRAIFSIAASSLLAAGIALGLCFPSPLTAQEPEYDLLIAGGTVVDGTGTDRFRADVAVRDDRIVAVSREGIDHARARAVLDADGLIVAPGFWDNHAHIQTSVDDRPYLENFLRQGITTIIASLHSGGQPYPLEAYMDSISMAPNVGFFSGHSWARRRVMGMADRAPTPSEMEEMKGLVEEAMEDGALGFSTGLVYVPGNFAETGEVVELARVAARHGGIYVTHMRDEATGLLDSVRETIRVSAEGGLPAQINHHKAVGATQWGWSERSLALIDSARAEGLDVTHDLYPYTASSTGSSVLFPQWALSGDREDFRARVEDPETRARMEEEIARIFRMERGGGDLSRVQFRHVPSAPEFDGQTLADLAEARGMANTIEAGVELAIELQLEGGFSAIYHAMDEDDVINILTHPRSMIETDGDPVGYGVGHPHPRSYGAFPRVLARYVRELGVLSLEEAVKKMTSMPARQYGQSERGVVAEGRLADLTVFDPEQIQDLATFTEPHRYSVGVRHLVVNGVPVLRDGSLTGNRPGRVVRGPARPESVRSR